MKTFDEVIAELKQIPASELTQEGPNGKILSEIRIMLLAEPYIAEGMISRLVVNALLMYMVSGDFEAAVKATARIGLVSGFDLARRMYSSELPESLLKPDLREEKK